MFQLRIAHVTQKEAYTRVEPEHVTVASRGAQVSMHGMKFHGQIQRTGYCLQELSRPAHLSKA